MTKRKQKNKGGVLALAAAVVILIATIFSWLTGVDLGVGTSPTSTLAVPPTEPVIIPPVDFPEGQWWEVYFADPLNINDPETQWQSAIEGRLIEKINAAQVSIHIAAFEFDLTRVAEALIAAHNRGVEVQWVTDNEHGLESDEDPDHGQFAMLQNANIEVRSDTRTALMHNKFIIIDGVTLWTGSTNLTKNGVYKQNNNTIVVHSQLIATMYEREFQEMWNGQFGPKSPSQLGEQIGDVNGTPIWVVFTSEDGALETAIIPVVNTAGKSIRFMAFSFTDYPLAQAMITRAQAGADVQGVFEKVGSDTDAAEFVTLHCAGIHVRKDGNPSFLHHKVIIVDERFVITGSMNFSTNAEESNDENVIMIESPEIAKLYLEEFERVWTLAEDPLLGTVRCP